MTSEVCHPVSWYFADRISHELLRDTHMKKESHACRGEPHPLCDLRGVSALLRGVWQIKFVTVAVYCSVLQRVAACCSVMQCVAVCCSVLQCVAVCCSVLQCVAVRVAVRYIVLQYVAVCCSVLQCVAV